LGSSAGESIVLSTDERENFSKEIPSAADEYFLELMK
jgi:hypothetical protein